MRRTRKITTALALTALVAAPLVTAQSASGTTRPSARASTPQVAVKLPRGVVVGTKLPSTQRLQLGVTLASRNLAGLESFVAAVNDRGSALYHHYLTPSAFRARFGPSPSALREVMTSLRHQGFSGFTSSPNGLSIHFSGLARQVEATFAPDLVQLGGAAGTHAYSNLKTPRLIGPLAEVQSVLGLSNLDAAFSHAIKQRTLGKSNLRQPSVSRTPAVLRQQGCNEVQTYVGNSAVNLPNDLAAAYAMNPLYGAGDYGQGVHIAIEEFEPFSASDIATYQACFGTTTTVNTIDINGGPGALSSQSGEAALDIEVAIGLAPSATIDVYQGPNSGTTAYDLFSAMVNASTLPQVIVTSWGTCEANVGSAGMAAEHTLFLQAASQGQSVIAAAGDAGSTDCNGQPSSVAVDDPANQPQVLGVGGTTDTSNGEKVWNVGGGATGGGISGNFCMPSYQLQSSPSGIINNYSVHNASCTDSDSVQYMRQVPDVAAVADPNTGYVVLFADQWSVYGGTSAAAPLWASIAALVNASPFCSAYGSGSPGVQPSLLYPAANATGGWSSMFTDVTVGNNDVTGLVHGKYPATIGYDQASGLGVPVVVGLNGSKSPDLGYPGLAARMCFQAATTNATPTVTSIHPTSIKPGVATSITLTGSGFLPVAGATRVHLSPSVTVTATCSSTTSCTVPVPSLTTGTYGLTVEVERLATSTSGPSSALSVTTKTTTSITPLISPLSTTYGAATTFSADVTPSGATGTVTFSSGATTLCSTTLSNGSASCASPTSAAVGSYDVLASYSGDGTYASSNASAGTYAVNKATATLVASASPTTVSFGRTTSFSVAGLRQGSTGSVTYSVGIDNVCTATVLAGAASCQGVLTSPVGPVTVTAYYSGDNNDESSTTTVDLTITKATGLVSLTVPTRVPAEGNIALSATVSPTATSGQVTFSIGGRTACSAPVVSGTATCSTSVNLNLGQTTVSGSYSGSGTVGPGSASVQVTVAAGATTFVVKATPTTVTLHHAPLLLASGFSKTTSGTVTFKVGAVKLCNAKVTSGTARCSPPPMTRKGRVVVVASYAGDLRHRSSVASTFFTVR